MSRRTLSDRECPRCGSTYRPRRSEQKYCGRRCIDAHRRGEPCSIAECDKPTVGRGLCSMHWTRWRTHGDPEFQRPTVALCVVDGCDKAPRSAYAELCETHYYRLRRTGITDDPPPPLGRTFSSHGYVLVRAAAHPMANTHGYVYEHRLVAAEMLGRELASNEYVHHIDSDPTNNERSNLAVVSSSQHQTIHKLVDAGVDPHVAVRQVVDAHAR